MRIGFVHKGYPEQRNVLTPWNSMGATLVKIWSATKLWDAIIYQCFKKNISWLHNLLLIPFNANKCDAIHLFNGVWLGATKPWVVTFESKLPRALVSKRIEKKLIVALAHPNCRAIIALSACNKQMQEHFVKQHYPSYAATILPKLKQLYPPQELPEHVQFNNRNELHFIFVGTDFYRKGGLISVKAFLACFKDVNHIKLTIISTLEKGYVSDFSDEAHEWLLLQIAENEQITWLNGAGNDVVLNKLSQADVLLLPTYADTFGYSVIEGMANACVPVVSNIRALPELVNSDTGYLVETKIDTFGNLDKNITINEHATSLTKGLEQAFNQIQKDWDSGELALKKIAAHQWVKENCNMQAYALQLNEWMSHHD
jgi:glycosyltransferase involved in cell wall biosynthesis